MTRMRKIPFALLWAKTPLLLAACALLLSACAATAPGVDDEEFVFYPRPPQRPRVQYLTRYNGARDVEPPQSALVTFVAGDTSGDRMLRKPQSVAAYDGVILVADPGWDTVMALDLENEYFDSIGDKEAGKLRGTIALAVDRDGNLFVADSERKQVVQFDSDYRYVRAWGSVDEYLPSGVAVDDDFLYMSDRRMHQVVVFNRSTGEVVRSFGEFGTGDGQFRTPTSITIDERGHLFVTDALNGRVQEFDHDGNYIKSIGLLGDSPGTFARPKGSAIDKDGHLYVVDAAFDNVQIWDRESAQVLMAFGRGGRGPGDMYLPASVFITYDMNKYFEEYVHPDFELEYVILVANNYGSNRVSAYGFVHPKDKSRFPETKLPEDPDGGAGIESD